MNRLFLSTILTLACLTGTICPLSSGQDMELGDQMYTQRDGNWMLIQGPREFKVIPDELTVKFSPGTTTEEIAAIIKSAGLVEIRHNRLGFYDLRVPQSRHSLEESKRLLENARVVEAFPSTLGEYISNDPYYSSQYGLHNTGSGGGLNDADIDAPEAWAISTGDSSIIVAPLDSGIDYRHRDLGPNIWQNLGEDADGDGSTLIFSGNQWIYDPGDINNIDDDGNGKKDDFIGWDAENNTNDVLDPMGHGTHVSGIVAARTNNNTGVAGVAGGWGIEAGVSIMMVQVGEYGPDGSILDDAILYAIDNGARVITMSLSVGSSSAINAALAEADNQGVFVDCAAGNSYGGSVSYPADQNSVLAVSASDNRDQLADFSSVGPEIELAAPGDDIYSTLPGQDQGSMSGTSMSAPHVAGAAALVFSVAPYLDDEAVWQILTDTADDKGSPGWDQNFGHGRLNVHQALLAVADPEPLMASSTSLSARFGGTINFTLDAEPANAGRDFLLLGTMDGSNPGIPLPGGLTTLPLNWDWFTDYIINRINTPAFSNFWGTLDGNGQADAQLTTGSFNLNLIGNTMTFAYTVDEPFDFVSNAVDIDVVN